MRCSGAISYRRWSSVSFVSVVYAVFVVIKTTLHVILGADVRHLWSPHWYPTEYDPENVSFGPKQSLF